VIISHALIQFITLTLMAEKSIKLGRFTPFQNFIAACAALLILPLMPLWFEWLFTRHVKHESLYITASMYTIALGLSSRMFIYLVLSLLAGLSSAAMYGWQVGVEYGEQAQSLLLQSRADPTWLLVKLSWDLILIAAVVHMFERMYRHLLLREAFFEWE